MKRSMKRSRGVTWLLILVAAGVLLRSNGVNAAIPPAFPLKISANGLYLQDQNGVPFPILGDAGWEAPVNLNATDQATYLDDRVGRGFDAVLVEAIEHKFTQNKPPLNLAHDLPFTKCLNGSAYTGSPNGTNSANGNSGQFGADPYTDIRTQAPDFTFPNETFWVNVDAYISLCGKKGVLVLLWPSYVGYAGGDEGWMSEMVVNDAIVGAGGFAGQPFANASKSRLWNYGAWLADRYKHTANIVWVHGGDYGDQADNGGVFTSAQKDAVNDVFAGLKSVPGQLSTLHTAHWSRGSLATDLLLAAGSFDLESVYSNTATAQFVRSGYAHAPALPAFEIEDYYENDPNTQGQPDRVFQWWAMLGGIAGYFYGNNNVWPFALGWTSSLDSAGAQDMARMNSYFRQVAWYNLVPSGLDGMKALVTAGGGTAFPQSDDYVSAAAARDGSLLIAYVPPGHTGSLSVDMTAMGGVTHARWFNPTSGTYSEIASALPNTGTRAFTPPTSNGSAFNDWVLELAACASGSCTVGSAVPVRREATWVLGALLAVAGARLSKRRTP
jgi:Protein of unknown function (DUF4038)/Putative collagen-binding domain of a collagenase